MELKQDADPIASSDFWYDIFEGGYIKPENILLNDSDIQAVQDARRVMENFRDSIEPIMEEM